MRTNLIILMLLLMINPFNKIFGQKFNETDVEKKFEDWLAEINREENVDKSIIGFNFGLFESINGYTMYLIGSKSFDKEDEDWATGVDFEPKKKYFEFGKEFSKNKNWEDILKCSENFLGNYIRSDEFRESILSKAIGITTGFDDGNLTIIYYLAD